MCQEIWSVITLFFKATNMLNISSWHERKQTTILQQFSNCIALSLHYKLRTDISEHTEWNIKHSLNETEHQKHPHSLLKYLSALSIWKAFIVTEVCLHRACFSIFACARASRFKPQTPCSRSINKALISCRCWVWWSGVGQRTALATCVLCRSRLASKANIWKRNRILVKPGAQLMLFALKTFLKKSPERIPVLKNYLSLSLSFSYFSSSIPSPFLTLSFLCDSLNVQDNQSLKISRLWGYFSIFQQYLYLWLSI